jgi:hypothetical protein
MMLIAGASMLIVFGMPYLMDNSKSSSLPASVQVTSNTSPKNEQN